MQKFVRINWQIKVSQVRLIGPNGEQLGIVPTPKALEQAQTSNLDLVEVAPQVQPPVCRIMDFTKYKYEVEKKERKARKSQHQTKLKEIRVKPKIGEHDYQVKLKQMEKFLKRGDRVKVTLFFRGREMAHQDLGQKVIDRFLADSNSFAQVFKPPMREGRMITMTIAAK